MADLTIGKVSKAIGATQIGDSLITDTGTGVAVAGPITLSGSTSGGVALRVPAIAGSNVITFPAGTTDFSATGGAGYVLQQSAAGAPITVAALAPSAIGGLGTGVATWLATPSSANLLAATTDETGTGALVFATSPALAGNPTAPTPATSDNDSSIATTAYVKAQGYTTGNDSITLSGDVAGSGTTAITATLATVLSTPGTFQGLTINGKGLVTAAADQAYAPLASPTFTGTPAAPTATAGTATTQVATCAFVGSAVATSASLYLPLSGGNLTGFLGVAAGGTPAAELHIGTNNISAAAWTTNGLGLRVGGGTWTDTSSTGAVTETAANSITAPTLAASNSTTYAQASTLRISGAPVVGTNVAITNGYALAVGGNMLLSSTVLVTATLQTSLANANDAELYIQKSRTGGIITTGDDIGTIRFRGHDGTGYIDGAAILAKTSGTIAAGAIGGTMAIWTNGVSRMYFGPTGLNAIGTSINPQATLTVAGPSNATARTYQLLTDASNGSWCYIGDWGKTVGVATFGTENNGTGAIRDVALMRAGTEYVRLGSTGCTFTQAIIQTPAASVIPANNGELTVSATSNTSVTIRLKGTDGTVRSVALTLA